MSRLHSSAIRLRVRQVGGCELARAMKSAAAKCVFTAALAPLFALAAIGSTAFASSDRHHGAQISFDTVNGIYSVPPSAHLTWPELEPYFVIKRCGARWPAWSPNGRHFAFELGVCEDPFGPLNYGRNRVYVSRPNGHKQREVGRGTLPLLAQQSQAPVRAGTAWTTERHRSRSTTSRPARSRSSRTAVRASSLQTGDG